MLELRPNDRSIAGFTMLGHATVHWFETSIPIFLVVWLAEFPDAGVAVFGLVVALGYAPFGLGALPAGVLADRYGPKRLVLVCLAGTSTSFLLLSLADSVLAIAAALLLWGIAASVYHPAGLALISTGVEDRGTVFAYHGIAGNAGIALGPFVAATLLLVVDWQLVAALLALPGLIGFLYGLRAQFDPAGGVDADSVSGRSKPFSLPAFLADSRALFAGAFALVFAIVTVEGLFYRGVLTYLPEILHGLPATDALDLGAGLEGIEPSDYLYVSLLVVGMAGQYVGGKLTDAIAPERGLAAIFAVLAVLALAFVPVASLGLPAVAALCVALGFFLFAIQPFYQEAVAVYSPADARGLSYGYTYLGEFGLGAVSVAIGGVALGISLSAFVGVLVAFALVGAALSVGLAIGVQRIDDWGRSTRGTATE